MKKYTFPTLYRGQPIHKVVWAKSDKDAAQKLDISLYTVKNYCGKQTKKYSGEYHEDIRAYFDSGELGRFETSLFNVVIPLEKMTEIIDKYKDKEYNEFLNNIK